MQWSSWVHHVGEGEEKSCLHTSEKAPVEIRKEFHFSLRLRKTWSITPQLSLTGSYGVGLRHWLLHLWDHQVCGGQELVCGHRQPDRAAVHHHIFCRVSVCVHIFLNNCDVLLPVCHKFDSLWNFVVLRDYWGIGSTQTTKIFFHLPLMVSS